MTVNVAAPTGIPADDTQAIKDAIAAVPAAGDVVLFPAGTYQINDLILLKSNLSLAGTGPGTRIHFVPPGGALPAAPIDLRQSGWMLFYGVNVSNLTIRGLVLSSSGGRDAAASAIVIQGSEGNLTVDDCEIYGFKKRGIRTTASVIGTPENFIRGLRVTGCSIHDLGRTDSVGGEEGWNDFGLGIQPNACDGVYIARNVIANVGTDSVHWAIYPGDSKRLLIVDNQFTDCAGGIGLGGDIGVEGLYLTNNTIDLTNSPAPWPIGINLTGEAKGVVSGNSLMRANIRGNFAECAITDNTIDLQERKNPDIGGIWVGPLGTQARRSVIANNRIFNGSSDGVHGDVAIKIDGGADITVANNLISDMRIGIEALGSATSTVERIVIQGNQIDDVLAYVHLRNVSEVELAANRGGNGRGAIAGIQIDGETAGVRIHGNRFGGPVGGIRVTAGESILLEDNIFETETVITFDGAGNPQWPATNSIARRNRGDFGEPSAAEEEWWWAFGADFVTRFISQGGESSVLGGTEFKVKITTGTEVISGFKDGYLGQLIHLIAVTPATLQAGNITLAGGIPSYSMAAGDAFTFVQVGTDMWEEVARTTPL